MTIAGLPDEIIDRLNMLGLEPLTRFQFAVSIEGQVPGSGFIAGFHRVEGLAGLIEVRDVREAGYRGIHQFPRRSTPQALTLTRGLTFSRYLWNWYLSVLEWTKGKDDYRRNVSVYQLLRVTKPVGEIPFEVWRWDLAHAWPSEWHGPEFDSMAEEIAFEQVVLRHAGLAQAQGIFSGAVGEGLGVLT